MAFVQARQGYFSGTSTTLAYLSNVTANSLLVVSLHAYNNVTDAVTVSDSQGNTYTRRILANNGSLGLQIWWAIAGSSAADTITVTFPGATYCSIGIHEYSGMATSLPVDTSNSATGSSTTPSSGAITTTNASDTLFAAYVDSNGTNFTISGDGDYTQRLEYEDGVNYMHQHTQDRVVTNTLTDTANWTIGASAAWVGGIVAFKAGAGGGPYTLTADAGSLSLSGQTARLLYGHKLGAAAGSLAISGQTAALKYGHRLVTDAGSLVLTGRAAALLYGHRLSAASGDYALTGPAAGLLYSRILSATTGAYILTGIDARLLLGHLLQAATGAIALTGQDVTLTYSGGGPQHYILTAEAGSYALTGQAALLLAARLLSGASGAYAVSGQYAGLLFGRLLGAGVGAHTIAGQDVGVILARLLGASAGDYAISGQAVTLIYSGASTPTPAARIFVISADDRAYVIAVENRTFSVPAENRVYVIT